jgi:hypothetical protein
MKEQSLMFKSCNSKLVYLFTLIFFAIGFNYSRADKVTDTVWNSIMHQLSWEKYWFGDFIDEESYEKLIGKSRKVYFYYSPEIGEEMSNITDGVLPSPNNNYFPFHEFMDGFSVYIDGMENNFIVTGFPEVRGWKSKPRSFILETSTNPSNYKKKSGKWGSLVIEKRMIPAIKPYQPVNPGNLSQDTVVLEAVKKALSWVIFADYFDPAGSPSTMKKPSQLNHFDNRMITAYIASYQDTDPCIIIYCENTHKVYLMDYLDRNVLKTTSMIFPAYSPSQTPVKDSTIQRIKENSIQVTFLLDSYMKDKYLSIRENGSDNDSGNEESVLK